MCFRIQIIIYLGTYLVYGFKSKILISIFFFILDQNNNGEETKNIAIGRRKGPFQMFVFICDKKC